MRSRTDSESVRTSKPSTWALPPLRGKRPVSILMTVVFPLPLGPRKPKISPFSTRKLTSLTAVKLPKRRTRCSAEMATSPFLCGVAATALIPRFQFHIGSHTGKDAAGGIIDADFYANDLVDALLACLHIARQEFGLLVDLLDEAIEGGVWKRIDANLDLILFEKSGYGSVWRDEVTRANVKNFDRSGGGSGDLALPETSFVVSIGCLGQVDVFATVAALEFFQIGLRLMVVRFGGGDFLRTVAALEFIELVLSTLLLRDRDFPVSFG